MKIGRKEHRKHVLAAACIAAGIMGAAGSVGTLQAEARIIRMADGGYFDPQYYAAQNPDVVAEFGTRSSRLYYHYTVCGKKEGRLPFEGAKNTTTAQKAAPATQHSAMEQEAVAAINQYRKQRGLKALLPGDQNLQVAAEKRAAEFSQYFTGHTITEMYGLDPAKVHAGIPSCSNGENLGAGQGSAADVVSAWALSPSHRNQLINQFTYVSVGLCQDGQGRFFWAAEFQ